MPTIFSAKENKDQNIFIYITVQDVFWNYIGQAWKKYYDAKLAAKQANDFLITSKTEYTNHYKRCKNDKALLAHDKYVYQAAVDLWKESSDAVRYTRAQWKAAVAAYEIFKRDNPKISIKKPLVHY